MIRLPLSALVYPRECVNQAVSAFAHICAAQVTDVSPTGCFIEISPGPNGDSDEDQLVNEFLNYLLDLSLETHLCRA
jgi:hypothetical protein